jgi:hypothetical protein
VVPDNGEPFEMTARGLIEEFNLARFQQGSHLELVYLPDGPTHFSIPNFETSEALTRLIVTREKRDQI